MDPNKQSGLNTEFYLFEGYEVMLTSNFWSDARLNNGDNGEVFSFVYINEEVPRSGNLPEPSL